MGGDRDGGRELLGAGGQREVVTVGEDRRDEAVSQGDRDVLDVVHRDGQRVTAESSRRVRRGRRPRHDRSQRLAHCIGVVDRQCADDLDRGTCCAGDGDPDIEESVLLVRAEPCCEVVLDVWFRRRHGRPVTEVPGVGGVAQRDGDEVT